MADDEFDDIISEVDADADAIEIDLSEEVTIKPVPVGKYLTRILAIETGLKTGDGRPMLGIKYGFADPDFPEYAKKTSKRRYMLVGGGVGFLTDVVEHFTGEVDRSSGKLNLSRSALIGQEAVCVWSISENNPKYNEVEVP